MKSKILKTMSIFFITFISIANFVYCGEYKKPIGPSITFPLSRSSYYGHNSVTFRAICSKTVGTKCTEFVINIKTNLDETDESQGGPIERTYGPYKLKHPGVKKYKLNQLENQKYLSEYFKNEYRDDFQMVRGYAKLYRLIIEELLNFNLMGYHVSSANTLDHRDMMLIDYFLDKSLPRGSRRSHYERLQEEKL